MGVRLPLLAAALASTALSLTALSACSAGAPDTEAPDVTGLTVLDEDPSHEHVRGPLTYDAAPPMGGEHNPNWLACDVYDEMPPLELAVHSLEHGSVWLAYRPGTAPADVDRLVALREGSVESGEWVLVAPYEDLRAPVVATTWGASLAVERADDPRLAEFVEAYAGGGQGGEKGVPCASAENALDVEQGRALLAAEAG